MLSLDICYGNHLMFQELEEEKKHVEIILSIRFKNILVTYYYYYYLVPM